MNELVEVLIPPLSEALVYRLPLELADRVYVGSKVEVPLGSRLAQGFVISRNEEATTKRIENLTGKLKSIETKSANERCFDASQLEFFRWVADYYADTLSNVIDAAIPQAVSRRFLKTVRLAERSNETRKKSESSVLSFLAEQGGSADYSILRSKFKSISTILKSLEQAGAVVVSESEVLEDPTESTLPGEWAKTEIELNSAQREALQQITSALEASRFGTFLLHGVTGSGKTEVYIELFKAAIKKGLGALIIVPEIALTPQLVDRFRARLGDKLSILHSALSKRARWEAWRALVEGRHSIALGTRSSIFAPVPKLGLIVVDEEHDPSLKQSDNLRYHGRDLAIVRGKLSGCPVVLGSATPSLESLQNAWSNKYRYLSLPARPTSVVENEILLVDLSKLKPWQMVTAHVSPPLHEAIKETLQRNEQVFILYNRRGFASYLQCELCDFVLSCPNCSVTLTMHQAQNLLCCHYCNFTLVPPLFCTNCKPPQQKSGNFQEPLCTLVQRGAGTERIVEELKKLFPDAVLDRLDRDSVQAIEHYREILDRVRNGTTQILVGTQMIAKGHDLPNVTLVGIADCDVGLHIPDFRASERVFQLLTQAAGRAGRGSKPGKVILQTRLSQHPSLRKTLEQDFVGFAKQELKVRKALGYPPYRKILRIISSATEKQPALNLIKKLRPLAQAYIQKNKFQIQILGPAPAPLEKIKARWRFHLLLKASKASELNALLHFLRKQKLARNSERLAFDVDPQDML